METKNKNDRVFLSKKEILSIPADHLPLATLSYNHRSVIATLINIRRKSRYNHFMWMHKPGFFASQDLVYHEVPVKKYLKSHELKLWYNPNWTNLERHKIKAKIDWWLKKPSYSTRYDWVAIIGQLVGLGKTINNPFTRICSDYGSFLKLVDPRYSLQSPAPDQVNRWLKNHSEYKVYGRYAKD